MTIKAPGEGRRKGISLKELFKRFPDDATAEAWFAQHRWNGNPACPYCGSENVQTGAKHHSMPYRCREKECAKRFSVKMGTVMQSSNLGFQVWAIAIFLMTTSLKSVSSMKLHRDLDITRKSAWHLAHRLRKSFSIDNPAPMVGPCGDAMAYNGMPFDHETVRYSVSEYVREQAHTNGIESFRSLLKRAHKGTFHKINPKHLERYVEKFAGRLNIRELDTKTQMTLIAQWIQGKRLRYQDLIA